jgi:hypothetical protein
MKRAYGIALGAAALVGLGAGLMFFFDPKNGARRRTTVRNKTAHGYRTTADHVRRTSTNVANRARGLAAMATSACGAAEVPNDDVLLARVKSRIGHVLADSRAIEVKTDHGLVSVAGKIGYRDAQKMLKTIASIRGVSALENHLAIETTH